MTLFGWHIGLARRMFGVRCPDGMGTEMRGRAFGPFNVTLWRFYPVIWTVSRDHSDEPTGI